MTKGGYPVRRLAAQRLEDRSVPAGTIELSLVDGELILTGDHQGNGISILVDRDSPGTVWVTPDFYAEYLVPPPTDIFIGAPMEVTFLRLPDGSTYDQGVPLRIDGVRRGIRAAMGDGDDRLHIINPRYLSDFEDPDPHHQALASLSIDMGSGRDYLWLGTTFPLAGVLPDHPNYRRDPLHIAGDLTIETGPGDDFFAALEVETGGQQRIDGGLYLHPRFIGPRTLEQFNYLGLNVEPDHIAASAEGEAIPELSPVDAALLSLLVYDPPADSIGGTGGSAKHSAGKQLTALDADLLE